MRIAFENEDVGRRFGEGGDIGKLGVGENVIEGNSGSEAGGNATKEVGDVKVGVGGINPLKARRARTNVDAKVFDSVGDLVWLDGGGERGKRL